MLRQGLGKLPGMGIASEQKPCRSFCTPCISSLIAVRLRSKVSMGVTCGFKTTGRPKEQTIIRDSGLGRGIFPTPHAAPLKDLACVTVRCLSFKFSAVISCSASHLDDIANSGDIWDGPLGNGSNLPKQEASRIASA